MLAHLLAAVPAASVTDSLATFATNVVTDLGVIGVFVLMLLDCACIPIPSEVTMLFAGFSVSQGHHSLPAVIVAGVLGNVVGSVIAWAVGHLGADRLRARRGARFLLHERQLERAHAWFDRYGSPSVFFGRMLPLVRTFISLPAGLARMPLGRFTVATVLGCIPWVVAWALVGDAVGHNWTQWRDHLRYVDYVVVAGAVVLVAYFVARRMRNRTREAV